MPKIDHFEDIDAGKKARELTKSIYEITAQGNLAKDFALKDQLRRAVISIMANIAEGFEREGNNTQFVLTCNKLCFIISPVKTIYGGIAMARPKKVIDAAVAEKAEVALKGLPNSMVCVRLKAIVSCAHYPISLVSAVFNTNRTTLWRWIKRFASQGISGLADESKGHKSRKLGAEQQQKVAAWLEDSRNSQGEPVFWTLPKLMLAIESEFGVSLGKTATWDLVRHLGFRQKVPRPHHAKADKQAQESFKKNL